MKHKEHIVFIPGRVPSSKNSRVTNRKTGRSFPSPVVQEYYKITEGYWLSEAEAFRWRWEKLSKPWPIYFHFHRKSKHAYDWINPAQTVQDRMKDRWIKQKEGVRVLQKRWIGDDDISEMIPFPLRLNGAYTTYDKFNPGVTILITNMPAQAYEIRDDLFQ